MIKREEIKVVWVPPDAVPDKWNHPHSWLCYAKHEFKAEGYVSAFCDTPETRKEVERMVREHLIRSIYSNVEEKQVALREMITWIMHSIDPHIATTFDDLEEKLKPILDLLKHK